MAGSCGVWASVLSSGVGFHFPEPVERFQPIQTSTSSVATLSVSSQTVIYKKHSSSGIQLEFFLEVTAVRAHVDVPQ